MTKLQEEILASFEDLAADPSDMALAAAEVARKYIEKALADAFNQSHYSWLHPDVVKRMEYNEWERQWLKENGITE